MSGSTAWQRDIDVHAHDDPYGERVTSAASASRSRRWRINWNAVCEEVEDVDDDAGPHTTPPHARSRRQ